MAELRDAHDAEHFLIKDASSAIRSIMIVETTTASWLTISELGNQIRSLTALAEYTRVCSFKVDKEELCLLHTSVKCCVYSNEELEPSSDFE